MFKRLILVMVLACGLSACSQSATEGDGGGGGSLSGRFPNITSVFAGKINLDSLDRYANQPRPFYITRDNTPFDNQITDRGATLGRVLFYDTNLSSNNSTSCASCHVQSHAFGDLDLVSVGANGNTGRHSMRLINSRFSQENRFFWDERAANLESQVTQPIRDHNEMGFSGVNGAPSFDNLITKMNSIPYYPELFEFVFGDSMITEGRMQVALAQFIRSIQSFDSRYDQGRQAVANDQQNFPNFTLDENIGKQLFMNPIGFGGIGCASCHAPPEFDIIPQSLNNGRIGVFGSTRQDISVTKSPTLRDLVDPFGNTNGNYMHDASHATLDSVMNHYIGDVQNNVNLDVRLRPNGFPQRLGLNQVQKNQVVQFLRTLTGNDVYTNPKWSSPF